MKRLVFLLFGFILFSCSENEILNVKVDTLNVIGKAHNEALEEAYSGLLLHKFDIASVCNKELYEAAMLNVYPLFSDLETKSNNNYVWSETYNIKCNNVAFQLDPISYKLFLDIFEDCSSLDELIF